tara:strand:- start:1776 stop:2018 length:243 start_codon:yes stop_codon:yes gene_type:complete
MEHTKIASPCVSVCKSDPISGFCYGCGRTDAEKDKWRDKSTTINWKKENILELKSRLSGWVLVAFEKSYANKNKKINKIN